MKTNWKTCPDCHERHLEPACPYCEAARPVTWKAMPGTEGTTFIVENGSRNVAYLSHVMPGDLKKFEAVPLRVDALRDALTKMYFFESDKVRAALRAAGEVL